MIQLVVLAISLFVSVGTLSAQGPMRFLTERDGKLYDGEQEFRFVSWNLPNLHNVEDAFEFLGESPWRWPDEFEITDALESVRQMGGRVVRTYVLSVRREGGDMGSNVHVLAPGEFNEEAFRTLDLVLKVAAEKGIRVMIPLVDNWHWWGGVRQYEAFRGKPKDSFWSDPQLLEDFKQTAKHLVMRRNTLTGVLYRDDPAIFGWETGNELDSTPEWTRKVSAYLKELDPNHLVIDGNSLNGIPTASLDDPHIDVVTTHHYPNVGNNNAEAVTSAARTVGGRKAYFVGEFGFLPVKEAQRVLDTVNLEGASGALYWSLRFHRREGGFYWHDEPSGDNLFKAYHWPGFPEGEAYREHLVMPMIREAAYRIQGLAVPPMPVPDSPTMLKPSDPRLLSWQGSAGARTYELQRAERSDGPWATVAQGLSDAAVQYRPLYADETAEVGKAYYYRVVAGNESGSSAPSSAVGPVTPIEGLLVDEMLDDTRQQSAEGPFDFVGDKARRVQEDIHRLRIQPGTAVTYRAAGPITSVQAWLFDEGKNAFAVEQSDDGKDFQPIATSESSAGSETNDYGYLRPRLVTAKPSQATSRWVRISLPQDATQPTEISRVEIRFGG